jgi:hypothetical protein
VPHDPALFSALHELTDTERCHLVAQCCHPPVVYNALGFSCWPLPLRKLPTYWLAQYWCSVGAELLHAVDAPLTMRNACGGMEGVLQACHGHHVVTAMPWWWLREPLSYQRAAAVRSAQCQHFV